MQAGHSLVAVPVPGSGERSRGSSSAKNGGKLARATLLRACGRRSLSRQEPESSLWPSTIAGTRSTGCGCRRHDCAQRTMPGALRLVGSADRVQDQSRHRHGGNLVEGRGKPRTTRHCGTCPFPASPPPSAGQQIMSRGLAISKSIHGLLNPQTATNHTSIRRQSPRVPQQAQTSKR